MKKLLLIILVLLAVYYLATQSRDQEIATVPTANLESTQTTNITPVADSARYIAHSTGWEDRPESGKVVFFYASWCPTCIPVDQELRSNMGDIPSDVLVIRVNYNDPDTDNEERELAKKYGITYQHTFVQVDAQGQVVKKWNGGGLKDILGNLE